MNKKYIAITESALDIILLQNIFDEFGFPKESKNFGIWCFETDEVRGFATYHEAEVCYFALINVDSLKKIILGNEFYAADAYRRIARVLKGMKSPPIHLPRQWSEFHFKNLLAFFATPRVAGKNRWLAETNSEDLCVRFESLSSSDAPVNLANWKIEPLEILLSDIAAKISNKPEIEINELNGLVPEVDLKVIGSGSVVKDRTFEDWATYLAESQRKVLSQPVESSVRIIGPAGSGKTLALCLRAIQVARDNNVISKGKKILVVTHSWAMAERIDAVLGILNGGMIPESITTFPLISLLQLHGGQIGQEKIKVIGDDSSAGRLAAVDIIKESLRSIKFEPKDVSPWISESLAASADSRSKAELIFNLREEFSGVLSASSLSFDDAESVRKYVNQDREDWMPPFFTKADRLFVLKIYKDFFETLIDRSSVTTDQFVLDSIRVLETFTWRMRRETDGYDFIFIDELQLFDSQERTALHLLGRSSSGVPFITAEDPSQGVFSALHSRNGVKGVDQSVYLDSVHRFEPSIFNLIKFIYQKFPLNTIPLKIDNNKNDSSHLPKLFISDNDEKALQQTVVRTRELFDRNSGDSKSRICIVTLGDVDNKLRIMLEHDKIPVVQLSGFDDVEQLAYSRRSVILAPWEFIGGTQFSHVIVLSAGMLPAKTTFGKQRELTAVYLASSRSAISLDIVCAGYVPNIILEAKNANLIVEENSL